MGKEKKGGGVGWGGVKKLCLGLPLIDLYDSEMKVLTDEKRGISYTMLK
jgi:hypothetical protein